MKCLKVLEKWPNPENPMESRYVVLFDKYMLPPPLAVLIEPIICIEYNETEERIIKSLFVLSINGDLAEVILTEKQKLDIIGFIKRQGQTKDEGLQINIDLKEQKCIGNSKFNGNICITQGIQAAFGNDMSVINLIVTVLIRQLRNMENADYLQIAVVNGIEVYIIDRNDYVTIMLPSENEGGIGL